MNKNKRTSIIIAAVALAIACVLPFVFTTNYYLVLFSTTLVNLIALLGLNIVMGMAGQSNLGTIGIVALGSSATAIVAQKMGSTTLLGLLAAIIVGIIIGLMLGYPSLRVNGIFLTLTTLSFAQIVYSLSNSLTDITGGAMGIKDIKFPNFFGLQIGDQRTLYFIVLIITILFIIFSFRVERSKWGRALKSVRDNPEAVASLGLNVTKLKLMAFLIATLLGCISGALYVWVVQYVAPTTFATDLGTKYVVMLMLGGVGSTIGMIIGSIVVTLLPEMLRFMGTYYQLVFYAFALALLLFYPLGLHHMFATIISKVTHKANKED